MKTHTPIEMLLHGIAQKDPMLTALAQLSATPQRKPIFKPIIIGLLTVAAWHAGQYLHDHRPGYAAVLHSYAQPQDEPAAEPAAENAITRIIAEQENAP